MTNPSLLPDILKQSIARFTAAAENFVSEKPIKVWNIHDQSDEKRIFKIPMLSFRWEESFEGLHTMLLDDNLQRTICVCKSYGAVRLPPYSHKRNERIIVIEGKIIDHVMQKEYPRESIIDYSKDTVRDLEFIDCTFNIILTPPLDFHKD